MKKLYLITGFLGAGKTTFLNHVFRLFPNNQFAVIVNEYGNEGIDGGLLSGEKCFLEEINQGSIFCVCKSEQFMEALVKAFQSDAQMVLVETSGLSNPANIDDMLEQVKQVYQVSFDYRGCITLVDAKNFHKVLSTAVVIPDQIRQASLVIINKRELVSKNDLLILKQKISDMNPNCDVVCTMKAQITKELFHSLKPIIKSIQGSKVDISSAQLTIEGRQFKNLSELQLFLDQVKGYLYRCKGYAVIGDKNFYIDGVMEHMEVTEVNQALSEGIVLLYQASKPIRQIVKQWNLQVR